MNSMQNSETDNSVGKLYSIGDFLEKFSVHVPMLQRDYAQGRENKEYIRKIFLTEIKEAIETDKPLILDFIYGYKDENANEVFFPLDGQQRLTTVWLVYWYLALKANKLKIERNSLLKFSYEIRKSSREFFEALCNNNVSLSKDEKIVEYIQNQTWFFAAWKNDPSINAMLRTLGGTNNEDGIEPLLNSLATNANKWERKLNNFKTKIQFYILDISGDRMPIESAERLYVKMNARGKSLTDFENFKADFISYIKKLEEPDQEKTCKISAVNICTNLDNNWNNIFWESTDAGKYDGTTDEVFFAFINRYCYNLLCVTSDSNFSELIKKIDKVLDENNRDGKFDNDKNLSVSDEEINSLKKYKYFTEENHSYEDFAFYYKDLLDCNAIGSLSKIFDNLQDNLKSINDVLKDINSVVGKRERTEYNFIPYYEIKDNKIETRVDKRGNTVRIVGGITQKERLYFFAICEYLEQNKFDSDSFKSWMRFCRNIIENSGIDSVGTMISCMKSLNGFRENSADINNCLRGRSNEDAIKSSKYGMQLAEEIAKSKRTDFTGIIEAENYSVFCGHIAFLFTNGSGEVDWNDFETKYSKVKTIFDDTGEVDYNTVKKYAESFSGFDDATGKLIFHQSGWKSRGDNWLDVLYTDCEKTHYLLMNKLDRQSQGLYDQFLKSRTFEKIVKKEDIMEGKTDLRVASYNSKYALYKLSARDKLYFDDDTFKRGERLGELIQRSGFSLDSEYCYNVSESYFWGEDIGFKYDGKDYIWTIEDKICEYKKGRKGTEKISEKASLKSADEIIGQL